MTSGSKASMAPLLAAVKRGWAGWKGEAAMVLLAGALVLVAYPAVAFQGKTFLASWNAAGVNGVDPPPRSVQTSEDGVRLDKGASTWAFEPWARVNNRIWRSGRVPLWNPYQGMGAPQAANFQSAVFDPLLAGVHINPTPLMWDLSFFLAFALGAAGLYLFLRGRGLDRLPSWTGTAVFVLSGYFFLYSNNHFFRTYVYLPILLYFADRLAAGGELRTVVLFGVGIAGCFLIGMPEATLLVVGTVALYALRKVVFARARDRWRLALRFGGAFAFGLALAAPLLLPAAEYTAQSYSLHRPEDKTGLVAEPPGLLLNWLLPYVYGRPGENLFGTGFSGTRNWVGVASLVMVLSAVASRHALRRYGGYFFAFVALAALLKCYENPSLRWVGHLPLFIRVNFPVFGLPVLAFCLATLTAIGVQALLDHDVAPRRLAVLSGILAVGLLALTLANWQLLTALPGGHLWGELLRAALFLAVAASAVTLTLRKSSPGVIGLLAAVAVFGELVALAPRGFQSDRADMFIEPTWVHFLKKNLPADQGRVFATDAKLFPNTAGAFGLQDVRSLDALYPERYFTYIRTFIQPEVKSRFVGGPFGQDEEQRPAAIFRNPMFDLTGVRYVVTAGADPGNPVINDFFATHAATATVRQSWFDIAGDGRSVLFVHSGVRAELRMPPDAKRLSFSFALHSDAFRDPIADGVDAHVVPAGRPVTDALWSTSIVPGRDAPTWRDTSVAIPMGTAAVELVVTPRGNASTDWSGFADLRIEGSDGRPSSKPQYRRVVSGDGAVVYENTSRLPRAFVVHEVLSARNQAEAIGRFEGLGQRMAEGGRVIVDRFDPRRQAVVEGTLQTPVTPCPGQSPVRITDHEADRVVVELENRCPGVLVLTDTYMSSWTAQVNDRRAKIHPANIAFRGVEVPAGRVRVVFTYRPRSFAAGVLIASGALAGATGLALATVIRSRRASRRKPKRRSGDDDPGSGSIDGLH